MTKKHERLGDAPIDQEYHDMMNGVAEALDRTFNGEARGVERKVGFVLLLFPFGDEKAGHCNFYFQRR
jgi:hypothetical protein